VHDPALRAVGPIFVFALVPFAVHGLSGGLRRFAIAFAGCAAIAGLYSLWHAVFGALLDAPIAPDEGDHLRIAIAVGAFALLFAIQGILSAYPHAAIARALYPRLFAGLYLDDLFTRLTFRIWPARRTLPESGPSARTSLR
jgi:NAD(P)H-quinone oxidoreductase subunit 5